MIPVFPFFLLFPISGSLKLIASLPDQLLLAHTVLQKINLKIKVKPISLSLTDNNKNNSIENNVSLNARLSFSTRPCSPLEPLVLGLISITEGINQHRHTQTHTQKQTNKYHTQYNNNNNNSNSVHGQNDTAFMNHLDPNTTLTSSLTRESGPPLGIKNYLTFLRALITTYCPPRSTTGTYVLRKVYVLSVVSWSTLLCCDVM